MKLTERKVVTGLTIIALATAAIIMLWTVHIGSSLGVTRVRNFVMDESFQPVLWLAAFVACAIVWNHADAMRRVRQYSRVDHAAPAVSVELSAMPAQAFGAYVVSAAEISAMGFTFAAAAVLDRGGPLVFCVALFLNRAEGHRLSLRTFATEPERFVFIFSTESQLGMIRNTRLENRPSRTPRKSTDEDLQLPASVSLRDAYRTHRARVAEYFGEQHDWKLPEPGQEQSYLAARMTEVIDVSLGNSELFGGGQRDRNGSVSMMSWRRVFAVTWWRVWPWRVFFGQRIRNEKAAARPE